MSKTNDRTTIHKNGRKVMIGLFIMPAQNGGPDHSQWHTKRMIGRKGIAWKVNMTAENFVKSRWRPKRIDRPCHYYGRKGIISPVAMTAEKEWSTQGAAVKTTWMNVRAYETKSLPVMPKFWFITEKQKYEWKFVYFPLQTSVEKSGSPFSIMSCVIFTTAWKNEGVGIRNV